MHRQRYTRHKSSKLTLRQVSAIRSLGADLPAEWPLRQKARECIRELCLPVGEASVADVLRGASFVEANNPFVRTPQP